MEFRCSSVVSGKSRVQWAEVVELMVDGLKIVVWVEVVSKREEVLNLHQLGKAVLTDLVDQVRENIVTDKLVSELKKMKSLAEKKESVEFGFQVMVWDRREIFLVVNDGMVLVRKNGRLGKVLEAVGGRVSWAKGNVSEDDVVIMGNSAFVGKIGAGDLGRELSNLDQSSELDQTLAKKLVEGKVGGECLVGVVGWWRAVEAKSPEKQEYRLGFRYWREKRSKLVVNDELSGKRKKWLVRLLVMLIVVFLGLVVFGFVSRLENERKEEVERVLEPVKSVLEQVEKIPDDQVRARELVSVGVQKLGELKLEHNQNDRVLAALVELEKDLEEWSEKLSGEKKIEMKVYFDFAVVDDDFFGSMMERVGDGLVVGEDSGSRLYGFGLSNKSYQLLGDLDEFGAIRALGGVEDLVYVVLEKGIFRLEVDDPRAEEIVELEEELKSQVLVDGFSENVYVLSKTGDIWRYRASGDVWVRQRWLAPGVKPDFTGVVDMEIDGDIWVVDDNGEVRQYSRGVSTGFGLSGWEGESGKYCCVSVLRSNEAVDSVFVLDEENTKIYRYDGEGVYQNQYNVGELGVVLDMEVYEDWVYLLGGDKVFRFEW